MNSDRYLTNLEVLSPGIVGGLDRETVFVGCLDPTIAESSGDLEV
jgi:hypothetical protein